MVWIASILKIFHFLQLWVLLTLMLSVSSFGALPFSSFDFMFNYVSDSEALFWKLLFNHLDSISLLLRDRSETCATLFLPFLNYPFLPVTPCHINLNHSFTVTQTLTLFPPLFLWIIFLLQWKSKEVNDTWKEQSFFCQITVPFFNTIWLRYKFRWISTSLS